MHSEDFLSALEDIPPLVKSVLARHSFVFETHIDYEDITSEVTERTLRLYPRFLNKSKQEWIKIIGTIILRVIQLQARQFIQRQEGIIKNSDLLRKNMLSDRGDVSRLAIDYGLSEKEKDILQEMIERTITYRQLLLGESLYSSDEIKSVVKKVKRVLEE